MKALLVFLCIGWTIEITPAWADAEVEAISNNMPGPVPAKKTYRVLCYSKAWGYRHASIPTGKKMIQVMADKTGLFEVTLTDELDQFKEGVLETYDAIFFNNTTHLQKGIKDPAMRKRIIDFVRQGGGLMAVHSATDGGWPEYTDLVGGNFDGHPWNANGTWDIANEDPTHPIVCEVCEGKNFELKDELYQYKSFDREKVRVLMSVDMSSQRNLLAKGQKRNDNDYALVWLRKFGRGRVFVSALGHNKAVFHHPEVLKMWLEGFRFILGELDAPTASIPKPTQASKPKPEPREPRPEVQYRRAKESMKEFEVQEDYSLELVLEDPMITEPAICVWDGNGRMYVAELRTYMQDADGGGTFEKRSQVVRFEDSNGDGTYDQRTVFAKGLLLPRMVLPLDDRILINETNTLDIYSYRDTDGDGVADEKKIWFKGGPRGGNLEHQPSGLVWGMDNWIYTTYNQYRLRFTDGKVRKESINYNRGQWGLTQDNYGKMYYVMAGAELGPVHFQFPIHYSNWMPKFEQARGFREVFPIDRIPDTQGGRPRLRKDNTLNHFTATCGQAIFRGDRLPRDLVGDLVFAEPVGRLMRRAKIDVDPHGRRIMRNAYPKNEFIRTTDPNFRPVNSCTGPDGCLYIVDMYRGIIQESAWVKPGSYLRKIVEKYGLDLNIGKGRIYRVRHKDFKPGPKPNMLNESVTELVEHLRHPNGWWRDEAQKLIILRKDPSVIPTLKKMATESKSHLARLHALWTLEGLEALDLKLLQQSYKDEHPQLRSAAIRLTEPFIKEDMSRLETLRAFYRDPHHDVLIQLLLSLSYLGTDGCREMMKEVVDANRANPYLSDVEKHLNAEYNRTLEARRKLAELDKEKRIMVEAGSQHYAQLCVQCHGADGRGVSAGKGLLAPSFVGNPRILGHQEALIRSALDGLTGPIDGKEYLGGMMIPLKDQDDEYISSVLTYIGNSWGNQARMVTSKDVARIRAKSAGRDKPYTYAELEKVRRNLALGDRKAWTLRSSIRPEVANLAIDGNEKTRYTTNTPMTKGMWFEIELPDVMSVNYLGLDAQHSHADYAESYSLQYSVDGNSWHEIFKEHKGQEGRTDMKFEEVQAKMFRVVVEKPRRGWWSIYEIWLGDDQGAFLLKP